MEGQNRVALQETVLLDRRNILCTITMQTLPTSQGNANIAGSFDVQIGNTGEKIKYTNLKHRQYNNLRHLLLQVMAFLDIW